MYSIKVFFNLDWFLKFIFLRCLLSMIFRSQLLKIERLTIVFLGGHNVKTLLLVHFDDLKQI